MSIKEDAARYRWIKSRNGLTLTSIPQPNLWKRQDGTAFYASHSLAEGGTQHAPKETLDETIDEAMVVTLIRDEKRNMKTK